jgi:porin
MIEKRNLSLILLIFYFIIFLTSITKAQSIWEREHFSGSWYGIRTDLANKGIDLNAVYTGDVFSNIKGGLKRQTVYLDNIDLTLNLNTEKLFNWPGGTIFIYGLGNQGKDPSDYSGDIQTLDNIAAFNTWKIYEAWIKQDLFNDKVSFLAGLYNLNSEFQVLESSSLFLNSSHGIGKSFSQSGRNGPSIFPTTALAFRIQWDPNNLIRIRSAVFNGTSGDPADPYGTKIIFPAHDGLLSVTEIQYYLYNSEDKINSGNESIIETKNNFKGKISGGFWIYSAKFPEVGTTYSDNKLIDGNYGFYLMGEYKICGTGGIDAKGLALFTRLGFSNPIINRFVSYTGFGAVYTGLISGRDDDQIGIAFAGVQNGKEYLSLQKSHNQITANSEWDIELTYFYSISPWLSLQPDIQYIIHPDTNPNIKNALAAGIRCVINF